MEIRSRVMDITKTHIEYSVDYIVEIHTHIHVHVRARDVVSEKVKTMLFKLKLIVNRVQRG